MKKILILLSFLVSPLVWAQTEESSKIDQILDQYFEESLQLNPIRAIFLGDYRFNDKFSNNLSDEYRKKSHDLNEKYLKLVTAIDRSKLDQEQQNSYDMFLWDRKLQHQSESLPFDLLPLNQFYSLPNTMAQLGSGKSAQPFSSVKDYQDFLKRMDGFLQWMKSAQIKMRAGMKQGIVQPRALMVKVVPQLSAMLVDDYHKSLFWLPVKNMPASFSAEQKAQIQKDYQSAITQKIMPAYQSMRDFVRDTYLPACRTSSGLGAMPAGDKIYQYLIKSNTTTSDLTAEQIHKIGLDEVARIHREMEAVKQQVKFKGSLKAFFKYLQTDDKFYFKNNQQIMARYQQERIRVEKVLPKYFDKMPKAKFEIRPVEKFRAQSAAGASYQGGTPDGKRKGIFYINTFNLKAQPKFGVETLFLHEAEPGHHFQISLAQEQTSLPKYRRFNGYTAFAEGWALYAESIGKEMGLFTDPYQYYGRLSDELLRAMRLVVDTGLHAKGWSREKTIQYMLDNSSMAKSDIVAEVERYMAIPGQALSYKIGQLRITGLRRWAEKKLGEKFDIKQFHNQVLLSGSLPLAVLENKIHYWVSQQLK